MVVRVEVLGLYVDPGSGTSIVLVGETTKITRVLPIFIGPAEAQAIAIGIQGLRPPRPGTHDLMINVIDLMGARLVRVTVTGLQDGAFLAVLELDTPSGPQMVDSRPSDAIALAVRVGADICIDQSVLDVAGVEVQHELTQPFSEHQIEEILAEFQEFLSTAKPSDFEQPATEPDVATGATEEDLGGPGTVGDR